MDRYVRLVVIGAFLSAVIVPALGSSAAASRTFQPRIVNAGGPHTTGPITGAAARAARGELVVPNPTAYAAAKASAAEKAASGAPAADSVTGPRAPSTL